MERLDWRSKGKPVFIQSIRCDAFVGVVMRDFWGGGSQKKFGSVKLDVSKKCDNGVTRFFLLAGSPRKKLCVKPACLVEKYYRVCVQ